MDASVLKKKWESLGVPSSGEYNMIRIDGKCKPDINLALNDETNRCLILSVPSGTPIKFSKLTKNNVRAYYDSNERSIILELLDEYYHELFDDLIISLYNVLSDINNPDVYTEKFIATINKWILFLSQKKGEHLSEFEIRGLIGELVCLNSLIEELKNHPIEMILHSWVGPFDETYDFESEDFAYEVKAKSVQSNEVKISNEFQLDPPPCGHLKLAVVSLESNEKGYSIGDIISDIRDKILKLGGDVTILYAALNEKNSSPFSWEDYNMYKYKIPIIEFYNASNSKFPALRNSDLGDTVRKVNYKLNLAQCFDFKMKSTNTPWEK